MAENSTTSQNPIKTVRLDDVKLSALLDHLDEATQLGPGSEEAEAYSYRKTIVVRMGQAGCGSLVPYLCPTRQISKNVLTFLRGGFVHTGTLCEVQLLTSHGTWAEVEGTVVSCALAEGGIHELRVKFDREVDPGLFCQAAVHHRVLLAEDTPTLSRLAEVHLKKLNAKVDCVPDGKQAVELALKNTYDLVLMDLDMPVLDGFEAAKKLREEGFSGLIVAFSALTDSKDQQRALEAGCDKFLGKPYTRDDLSQLLKFLALEPIYSTMQGDPAMDEIIKEFVTEFPARVRAIEAAIIKKDMDGMLSLLRTLKGVAGSYGFDIISEAAAKVETSMSQMMPWDELKQDLTSLIKLCGQVRS